MSEEIKATQENTKQTKKGFAELKKALIEQNEKDANNYEWAFTPIVELSDEEKKNYPIPGKEGEYYGTRLATEITETYKSDQFKHVCKRAGAVIESE